MDLIANLIESINQIDIAIFLKINNFHSPFFDWLMYWLSNKWIWIPAYLIILFYIFKTRKNYKAILICIGLLIPCADMTSSLVLKPLIERPRPCHQPEIFTKMKLVGDCGGKYGFVSSHAANTFAIATFIFLLFSAQKIWILGFLWAFLIAYSRVYLGVHFPLDVFFGAIIGIFYAYFIHKMVLPKLKF